MASSNTDAIKFWGTTMLVGPLVAFVLPLLVVQLLGGFADFELVGKPVSFLESFGILGALCFPCGTFLYAQSKWNQARAFESRNWPTVPGHVQSSEMERRITGLPMDLWKLALSYSYQVSGNTYSGDKVQFGPKWVSSRDLITAQEKKYPRGTTVKVYYDPDDPQTSVLETSDEIARQNRWQLWVYFLAPIIISACVVWLIAVKKSL